MKSYQVVKYGAALEARELDTPEPQGAEILVKIKACGVCHSDVHLWEGSFDIGGGRKMELGKVSAIIPFTPGHEIIGEVVAMGPEAEGASIGDTRVVYPWIGCGKCPVCEGGEENLCARPRNLGVNVDGGFSDYVLVPDGKYLYDFAGVPDALACTYACSGLTAFGALKKALPLRDGDTVMLIGAGGVGLMGVRFCKAALGVQPVVVDIDPGRRQAALDAGASEVLDPEDRDASKEFAKRTGGAAAVIDFVGAEQTAQYGTRALRMGGKYIIVGLFGGEFRTALPLIPFKAMTIMGSLVGTPGDMAELAELVRNGQIAPIPVNERPMDQASQSLEDLRAGQVVGRVVLEN
ncbi:MAG: alcohol dehydrogenase [Alphaproteobacteria bacterium]|nr:alcohol dehydrogenase [Alphaproteobacteria bacterium]